MSKDTAKQVHAFEVAEIFLEVAELLIDSLRRSVSKVLSITRTTTCSMELGMKQEIPLKSTCCRIKDVFSTFDVYEGYASLTMWYVVS